MVGGVLAAAILGLGPSPVTATGSQTCCGLGGVVQVVEHWADVLRDNWPPPGWMPGPIKPPDFFFSDCDFSRWHLPLPDLAADAMKCGEKLKPFIPPMAGANAGDQLTPIDCVENPEMAGNVRCVWD